MWSVLAYCLIFTITGSIFVGLSVYIDTMVENLQLTLRQLDQVEPKRIRSSYVNAIRFHYEIIEYDSRSFYFGIYLVA